jgi:hypothetical protein
MGSASSSAKAPPSQLGRHGNATILGKTGLATSRVGLGRLDPARLEEVKRFGDRGQSSVMGVLGVW